MIRKIYRNGYRFQLDSERPFMRFLGGGDAGKTKLSPTTEPDPIPTAEEIDIQAMEKGEAERRRLKSRKGRGGTILTESTLGTTAIAKSPILGVVGGE